WTTRMHPVFVARSKAALPIWFVTAATLAKTTTGFAKATRAFIKAADFTGKAGQHLLLPAASGIGGVLFGIEGGQAARNPFPPGQLPGVLPAGTYRFANAPHDARLAALAFALGSYRFTRYRSSTQKPVRLVLPESVDGEEVSRMAEAV